VTATIFRDTTKGTPTCSSAFQREDAFKQQRQQDTACAQKYQVRKKREMKRNILFESGQLLCDANDYSCTDRQSLHWSRGPLPLQKPQSSLLHSQKPATGLLPDFDGPRPQPHLKTSFNIIIPSIHEFTE
jgi:hypothetical protein